MIGRGIARSLSGKRLVLAALPLTAGVSLVIVLTMPFSAAPGRPVADERYQLDVLAPGETYEYVIRFFTRYGPAHRESAAQGELAPETYIDRTRIAIDESGRFGAVTVSIEDLDGTVRTVTETDATGAGTRRNLKTGEVTDLPPDLPAQRTEAFFRHPTPWPAQDYGESLLRLGFERRGAEVFRGRTVERYEKVDEVPTADARASAGPASPALPYVGDLNLAGYRGELLVDVRSGIVLVNRTYAVTVDGRDVRVASFEVLSITHAPGRGGGA